MASWGPLLAYVVNTVSSGGPELHWESRPAYEINQSGSADLSGEEFDAVERGFESWNAVCDIGYRRDGFTSLDGDSIYPNGPAGDPEPDGNNVVTWVESGWPEGPSVIGITWAFFDPSNGEIGEGDMLLNGEDYVWTVSDAGAQTDVESIVAHEAGHFLGLGHTDVEAATMFATVIDGETQKRSLHSDDIAGAQHLYGGDGGAGCGCDLAASRAASRPLAAAAVALAAAAWLLARRAAGVRRAVAPTRVGGARGPVSSRSPGAPRPSTLAVLVAAAWLAAGEARATVVRDLSLAGLAAESDAVVLATVDRVEATTDGRAIRTVQRLVVSEVLAGAVDGSEIDLVTPGGVLPEGTPGPRGYRGARAAGVPIFSPGEEVVVFVRRVPAGLASSPADGARARYRIAGLAQGRFQVVRAENGRTFLRRDLTDLLRIGPDPDARPFSPADPLDGMPLERLAETLRTLSTRTGTVPNR